MNETELVQHKEILELKREVATLTAQLEGDFPKATYWLQTKVWRQKKALDILNRKVLTQRFRLNLLASLGRDMSKEEYLEAKDALTNDKVKDRILDYESLAV